MKRIWGLTACAVALAAGLFTARAADAEGMQWRRAESAHFIVYSNTPDERTRAFIERLEAFDGQADKLYRQIGDSELPDGGKTVLYYVDRVADFDVVRPGSITQESYSFSPYLNCPFEDTRYYGVSMGESKQTAKSEYENLDQSYTYFAYAHTKNIKFFSQPLTPWLDRGLKYYLMTMNVGADKLTVGQMLPEMASDVLASSEKFVPFSRIIDNSYPKDTEFALVNAESWFLTHWLAATPESRQKLAAYIAKTNSGEDPVKAFVEATGKSPEDLMPVFKDYLAKGVPVQVYNRAAQPAGAITMTALPNYGEPMPLLAAAMWGCSGPYYGKGLLGRVRKLARAFPGDVLTQRTLLTGEVLFGDLKTGEAQMAVAPLLQITVDHPDDAEAFRLLGRLHLRLAENAAPDVARDEYKAARLALGQAYKLDPASPPTLALFALARADLPGYPDDQAIQAMDLAQNYSDGGYSLYIAEFDVRRDDYAGAAKALEAWRPERMEGKWKAQMAAIKAALTAQKPKAEIVPLITAYQDLDFNGNY